MDTLEGGKIAGLLFICMVGAVGTVGLVDFFRKGTDYPAKLKLLFIGICLFWLAGLFWLPWLFFGVRELYRWNTAKINDMERNEIVKPPTPNIRKSKAEPK